MGVLLLQSITVEMVETRQIGRQSYGDRSSNYKNKSYMLDKHESFSGKVLRLKPGRRRIYVPGFGSSRFGGQRAARRSGTLSPCSKSAQLSLSEKRIVHASVKKFPVDEPVPQVIMRFTVRSHRPTPILRRHVLRAGAQNSGEATCRGALHTTLSSRARFANDGARGTEGRGGAQPSVRAPYSQPLPRKLLCDTGSPFPREVVEDVVRAMGLSSWARSGTQDEAHNLVCIA
jgi:hypothetical protein